jgi:hypothetical protein
MIYISHRGNINGRNPNKENSKKYIDEAINLGYDVEIDIRYLKKELYLGHDYPQYNIDLNFLLERKKKLWIHTKDFYSLSYLIDYDLRIFFHEKEEQTIINNTNLIWSHNLNFIDEKSIIPLLNLEDINLNFKNNVFGICSDYVEFIKNNK